MRVEAKEDAAEGIRREIAEKAQMIEEIEKQIKQVRKSQGKYEMQVESENLQEIEDIKKMMQADPEQYIKKLGDAGDVQKLNQLLSTIYFY